MPRLTPIELCIANLRDDFPPGAIGYMTKQAALDELTKRTGLDFGIDAAKWEKWHHAHPEQVRVKATSLRDAIKKARHLKPQ